MIRPDCAVCGAKTLGPTGANPVTFPMTVSDVEWTRRAGQGLEHGHPPNEIWFCPKHAPRAERLMRQGVDRRLTLALLRWPPWLEPIARRVITPEPAEPLHDCPSSIGNRRADFFMSARVMGDSITDCWYRCPDCQRWVRQSVRDSFTGGEIESWSSPITEGQFARSRDLISQCKTPGDDSCRCSAHYQYFGRLD